MFGIDRYAYTNRWRKVHPAEKLALALVAMLACLISAGRLPSLLVIFLMAGLVVWRAGVPILFYLRLLCLPVSFLVAGVLTVAVSFSRETTLFLWGLKIGAYGVVGITAAGLNTAINLFSKSLGAVSCLYFLSLTTPAVEMIAVLRKLRLPPLFVELMSLVYRFIFVLFETAGKIYVAQSSRGGYATMKTAYFSLGQLVSNLFVKSYNHSRMLFTSLSARCYTGELNVLPEDYPLSGKNFIFIAIVGLALLAAGMGPGKGAFLWVGGGH